MAQSGTRAGAVKKTPRKPRALKAVEPVVLATLNPEHLVAVQKAHMLVSQMDLQLKAANHFLEKINDEIAESYELPEKFIIDLQSGAITEEG